MWRYVMCEQGKRPNFITEIAAHRSGREDTGNKHTGYAGLGVPEYWRFDQTGEFHRSRLPGDRLADPHRNRGGRYPAGLQPLAEPLNPM